MNTQPFFIGRMTDPIQAQVLHISVLDSFQVSKFLREQVKSGALNTNEQIALIADAHLNAKPSGLRLLRKAIEVTGLNVGAVFGEQGPTWAQYMDAPFLTEKPRMSVDPKAIEARQQVLAAAVQSQMDDLSVVNNMVGQALDRIDQASEREHQRKALMSFEERQQQKFAHEKNAQPLAVPVSNVAAPAPAVEEQPADNPNQELLNEIERLKAQLETFRQPAVETTDTNTSADTTSLARLERPIDEETTVVPDSAVEPVVEETAIVGNTEDSTTPEEPVIVLSAEEQRMAEEEDARFAQSPSLLKSTLAVEANCQSNIGQIPATALSVEHNKNAFVPMSVKPLRVKGRIRSGIELEHEGDVIVEGSVHPLGEVAAAGDIHVYGTGGGRLFAGIHGNQNACIYVHVFDAEIVSIAGYYHVVADTENDWTGRSIKISLENNTLNFEEIRLMPQRSVA